MIVLMWLGRLEMIPVVVLVHAALLARVTQRVRAAFGRRPFELVFLARLQDGEHLVARAQYGRADRELGVAVAHHRDQPHALRQGQTGDPLAGNGRVPVDLQLDDLEVLLPQLEQVHEVVLGDLVLDEAEDVRSRADGLRDAEQVEVRLVARVVDARDRLRDAVALLPDLADDEVVLVVAGDRQQDVRRTCDPRALERVDLGRVAEQHLVAELRLEPLEAIAPLLDQRHLVAHAQQGAGHIRPHLAAARHDRVHRQLDPVGSSGRTSQARTASVITEIAVCVGQMVRRPRLE